jgi:hypothetical protein
MLGDRSALLEAGASEVHPSVAAWVEALLGLAADPAPTARSGS